MQIVYLGFPGAACIEAAAAVQLLRLERFSGAISGCHLAVEAMHSAGGTDYDVRLDLVTRDDKLRPMPHCTNTDPEAAIRLAFDRAEQALLEPGTGERREAGYRI